MVGSLFCKLWGRRKMSGGCKVTNTQDPAAVWGTWIRTSRNCCSLCALRMIELFAWVLWPSPLIHVVALQISWIHAVSFLQISLMLIYPPQLFTPLYASLPWLSEMMMFHWSYFRQCYIISLSVCLLSWSGVMLRSWQQRQCWNSNCGGS